jgi:hypothetical protein
VDFARDKQAHLQLKNALPNSEILGKGVYIYVSLQPTMATAAIFNSTIRNQKHWMTDLYSI